MAGERVVTEEMHPDAPDRVHRGFCVAMIVTGAVLIGVGGLATHLWGPLRILFAVAGIVLLIVGFLLAVNVKGLNVKASRDGGIEATANRSVGYTRRLTISDSLVEGDAPPKVGAPPPKEGIMPPKEGVMPAKSVEYATPAPPARPVDRESAQGRPTSSAEP